MPPRVQDTERLTTHLAMLTAWLALASSALVSCSKPQSTPVQNSAQRTFASPAEAGAAVQEAAKAGDEAGLLAIFGPEAKEILFSGDAVEDKHNREDFVTAYTQMHRWRSIKAGGEMLYIGADNFLFPIPLGKNSSGAWEFDTAAGKDEILARRIGRDELAAIEACAAIAKAQGEYHSQARDGEKVKQYAQRILSDEGKHNGLYWPATTGQPPSPLEGVHEFAKAAGYTDSRSAPFNGYYFRILSKQGDKAPGGAKDYIVNGKMTGGFGVLAYPAEYRDSGIMTFIIGKDGVVYQKDLGVNTTTLAQGLTEYNPAEDWKPAIS
jgi:hypothetical protein